MFFERLLLFLFVFGFSFLIILPFCDFIEHLAPYQPDFAKALGSVSWWGYLGALVITFACSWMSLHITFWALWLPTHTHTHTLSLHKTVLEAATKNIKLLAQVQRLLGKSPPFMLTCVSGHQVYTPSFQILGLHLPHGFLPNKGELLLFLPCG